MGVIFGRGRHITIPAGPVVVRTGRGAAAAESWWVVAGKTCVAAYCPKGAASYAASLVNLANPGTYDAAPGVAPTWASATGWTGNGSSMYLTTGGLVPVATGTVLLRFSGATSDGALYGFWDNAATYQEFGYQRYLGTFYYASGAYIAGTHPTDHAGVIAIADRTCYLNGAPDKTLGASTLPSCTIYLLARYESGSGMAGFFSAASIQAFAIYSDTLTAVQVSTVSSAMAAL